MTLVQDNADLSERRWRRRSLWALLLIVPTALAVMSYDDIKEMARYHDLLPIDVAAGQGAHYGGSDWQFAELRTVTEGIKPKSLPDKAVPVVARLIVEIGDTDLKNLWLMCSIRLVDPSGRSWSPTSVAGLPRPAEGIQTCQSTAFSDVSKGIRRVVEETYLIPADVAGTVHVELGMHSERPHYLRFARSE